MLLRIKIGARKLGVAKTRVERELAARLRYIVLFERRLARRETHFRGRVLRVNIERLIAKLPDGLGQTTSVQLGLDRLDKERRTLQTAESLAANFFVVERVNRLANRLRPVQFPTILCLQFSSTEQGIHTAHLLHINIISKIIEINN